MPNISFNTPIGNLSLTECNNSITKLSWALDNTPESTRLLISGKDQLLAYFSGELKSFTLPLNPTGTAFQKEVWNHIQSIPIGTTRTYGWLFGLTSSSPRAIGGACGRNPIPILIPCHRITSRTGLGGYSGAGGALTKKFLLRLEQTSR